MPTFYYNGNLVHFAVFERHIGFYPTPSAIVEFRGELKTYKTSKGAIQFPTGEPLPLDPLTRIVQFRVAENAAQKRSMPRKATSEVEPSRTAATTEAAMTTSEKANHLPEVVASWPLILANR